MLLHHGVQVHLRTRSITASMIALWLHLSTSYQTRSITIFLLALTWPPNASPQTHSITTSERIAKFIWSRCGDMVELEDRLPVINSLAHLVWHPKGILENEQFWLEESRNMVRGYAVVPSHEKQHKLCESMNAWKGQSFSVILLSVYAPIVHLSLYAPGRLPPVKLNGSGSEKQIFWPQRPPCASLRSPNRGLQVLRLCLSTVLSQNDCM